MIPQGCNQGKAQSSCVWGHSRIPPSCIKGRRTPEIKVSQQLRITMRQARMETWLPNSVPTVPSPAHGGQSRSGVNQELRVPHKSAAVRCQLGWWLSLVRTRHKNYKARQTLLLVAHFAWFFLHNCLTWGHTAAARPRFKPRQQTPGVLKEKESVLMA